MSGRVRDVLLREPRHIPGQEDVAAALHVSARTLRRHLDEEGTSFRAVVEQTREYLAEELLVTAGLSVEQVADRLGYSESSSFVHAFRRWKGASPGRWAQTARADGAR
jgi:AraC-like DNA-binding protein